MIPSLRVSRVTLQHPHDGTESRRGPEPSAPIPSIQTPSECFPFPSLEPTSRTKLEAKLCGLRLQHQKMRRLILHAETEIRQRPRQRETTPCTQILGDTQRASIAGNENLGDSPDSAT